MEGDSNPLDLGTEGKPKGAEVLQQEVATMRSDYDFSKARRNPYAARLKRQITTRLDQETIKYFKMVSRDMGVPYQTLINLYLRECAAAGKRLSLKWRSGAGASRARA